MNNVDYSYDGYFTEQKLVEWVVAEYGHENVAAQFKVTDKTRSRFDVAVPKLMLLFEFDGAAHYTDATVWERDGRKSREAVMLGYRIIRIPYFVQWTTEVIKHHLPEYQGSCNPLFPHGFIDKKAILPGSFCKVGYERFCEDMRTLPHSISMKVVESLIEKEESGLLKDVVWGWFSGCTIYDIDT